MREGGGTRRVRRVRPEYPKSHAHSELAHVPCPVQLPGQSGVAVEQSSPEKPGSHAHTPASEHSPCPEQLKGQSWAAVWQKAPV